MGQSQHDEMHHTIRTGQQRSARQFEHVHCPSTLSRDPPRSREKKETVQFGVIQDPPSNHGVHIHTHDPSNQAQCNMTSSPDHLSPNISDPLDEELDDSTQLLLRTGALNINEGIPNVVVNDGPVSLLPELALAEQQSSRQDPKRRNLNNWSHSRRKRGENFPFSVL